VVALDVGSLILKVQQEPKLETRIRNGHTDAVRLGLLFGIGYALMRVHVEHAPNFVVLQVVISLSASILFGSALQIDSVVDESLGGQAARLHLDVQQIVVAFPFEAIEVAWFGNFPLAANEDAGTRLGKMFPTPQVVTSSGH